MKKKSEVPNDITEISDNAFSDNDLGSINVPKNVSLYNLTFHEALDIIVTGGVVKGKNFRKGYFLRLNISGRMVVVNAEDMYSEDTYVSLKSLSNQKFRELSVMTVKELSF